MRAALTSIVLFSVGEIKGTTGFGFGRPIAKMAFPSMDMMLFQVGLSKGSNAHDLEDNMMMQDKAER